MFMPLLACVLLLLHSCSGTSGCRKSLADICSERIDSLRYEAMEHVKSGRIDSVPYCADGMLDAVRTVSGAGRRDSLLVCLKGCSYAGELYLVSDMYGRGKSALEISMDAWTSLECSNAEIEDYYPVCVLYNAYGLYEIKENMNYEAATDFFLKGIEMAEEHSARTDYAVMYYNLAMSYFVREDGSGLKYALELLEDGKEQKSEKMIFMGEYSAALMYYVCGNYEEAEGFVKKAINSKYSGIDPVGIYCLYANVLMCRGDMDKAGGYFRKATAYKECQQATRASYLCLSYGNYMVRTGKLDSARLIYEEGLRLATEKQDKVFTYRLHKGISDVSYALGDYESAYRHLESFKQESDSIFSIKRERAVNALALKYESAKHENEMQKKNSMLQVLLVSSVSVTLILLIVFIMYRKKNRIYSIVARQYRESVTREQKSDRMIATLKEEKKRLEERLEPFLQTALQQGKAVAGTQVSASTEHERIDDLFSRLEELMSSEKLYREMNLTRNRVADILETNRTYLSQAINEKTGKNFNQYINGYRIAEALHILSDPDNDIPMKSVALGIGFGTPNTFFKIFREETGMTPLMYRDKINESRNGNLSL